MLPTTKVVGFLWISFRILVLICWLKPSSFRKNSKIISFAKEERIDKQYYVTSEKNFVLTKESAKDMVVKAEDFLVKMKLVMTELKNEQIEELREKFKNID